jgi:hypothetical protein
VQLPLSSSLRSLRGLFAGKGENFAANQKLQSLNWSRLIIRSSPSSTTRDTSAFLNRDLVIRMSVAKTLQRIKQFIPPLSGEMHKGQAGRVGVIGGSEE